MPTSIGGININVGANISNVMSAFKTIRDGVHKYKRSIEMISIAGAIKGDPFSVQKEYIEEGRDRVKRFYKKWSEQIATTSDLMSSSTKKYIKDIDRMEAAMDKLLAQQEKMKKFDKGIKVGGRMYAGTSPTAMKAKYGFESAGIGAQPQRMRDFFKETGYKRLQDDLKGLMKEFPKLKVAGEFLKKLGSQSKMTEEEVSADFRKLGKSVGGVSSRLKTNIEKLGNEFLESEKKAEKALYENNLKAAKSMELALGRQKKTLKDLNIEEARARTEIKLGINVSKNKLTILDAMRKRMQQGIKLTKSQRKEYKLLRKEEAKKTVKGGFLSPAWFKSRAKWFIELRLLWSVYRNIGKAVSSLTEFEDQLARALRTANSEMMDSVEISKQYQQAMRDTIARLGATSEQVGETLYQLGSAGLSAEESLAALDSTMNLVIGTEGDVRETTKTVAGIYNNFADTMDETMTIGEKFIKITDIMADAWENHQVEISELTDGYKYAGAVWKQAGGSLESLTAILAVSNDHLIKGSKAGRAFTSVVSRMVKTPNVFKKAFNLSDTVFDPKKKLEEEDFFRIFGELSKKAKESEKSLYRLGLVFERLGLRGAPEFLTLLEYWDEIEEAQDDAFNSMGANLDLVKVRMASFLKQWERFKGLLVSSMAVGTPILKAISKFLESINKELDPVNKSLKEFYKEVDTPRSEKTVRDSEEYIFMLSRAYKQMKEIGKAQKEAGGFIPTAEMGKEFAMLNKIIPLLEREIKDRYGLIKLAKLRGEAEKSTSDIIEDEPSVYDAIVDKVELLVKARAGMIAQSEVIAELDREILLRQKQIKAEITDITNSIKEEKIDLASITGEWKRIKKLQEELNQLTGERNTQHKDMIKPFVDTQNILKKQADIEIKMLQAEKKRLELRGVTKEDSDRIRKINERIRILMVDMALTEANVRDIKGENVELTKELLKLEKDKAQAIEDLAEEERANRRIATLKKEISLETQKAVNIKNDELVLAKRDIKDKETILKLEKELLEIRLKELIVLKEIYEDEGKKGTIDYYRVIERIRVSKEGISDADEKIKRNASIIYDYTKRIKEAVEEWHDVYVEAMTTFTLGLAEGFGNIWADFTMGFQEAQQEVANLKGDVEGLEKERDELTEGGERTIFTEDEADRLKEINQEMSNLKDEINDLENPLKNATKAIKTFFKSLIDEINRAIAKWIAMQIVMMAVKSIFGGSVNLAKVPNTSVGSTKLTPSFPKASFDIPSLARKPGGGISRGLTLIGDNKSGRELVIPEENISSDSVSGYMREGGQQPIYIANIITDADFQAAMSKQGSGRVIVNRVLEDIGKKGPIFKRLGGA